MNPTLVLLLNILTTAAAAAKVILANNPDAQAALEVEQLLQNIVTSGLNAYQSQVGKPLDLTALKHIDPAE